MRRRIARSRVALAMALSAGLTAAGQPATPRGPLRADLLRAAREIMQAARYCALITVDDTGRSRARTMDAFPPDENMTVWMATNPKTRKVAEVRRDPRVTLYYYDAASQSYVTITGRARLVDDKVEKQKRWKEEWKSFYPDRDASYLLIAVSPEQLEVLSPSRGIGNDPVTWKPPVVEFGAAKR
jgi:general stress protein 26